jgi:hypothetical protein
LQLTLGLPLAQWPAPSTATSTVVKPAPLTAEALMLNGAMGASAVRTSKGNRKNVIRFIASPSPDQNGVLVYQSDEVEHVYKRSSPHLKEKLAPTSPFSVESISGAKAPAAYYMTQVQRSTYHFCKI